MLCPQARGISCHAAASRNKWNAQRRHVRTRFPQSDISRAARVTPPCPPSLLPPRFPNAQNDLGELTHWDIILPRGNPELTPHAWTKNVITHKINRSPLTSRSIRVLSSPSDIDGWRQAANRDSKDAKHGGLLLYLIDRDSEAKDGRKFFSKTADAEDILGVVFIFPESKSNAIIEYISQ
jgi:hypothetical protein